nr:hypothetical protein [Deltaproteobacteria bacterium]
MSASATTIVGIGASAGGLKALRELCAELPSGTTTAYVVVQHLAPDKESLMAELLRRSTTLTVEDPRAETQPASDTIYVLPPGVE